MMKKRIFLILNLVLISLVLCSCSLFGKFVPATIPQNSEIDGDFSVTILDVGNADCIVVREKEKTLLIDAGNNADGDDVVNFLSEQGIEKLDYVVATHADADHIGGMDVVVNSTEIDEFIMPIMPEKLTKTTKTYTDLLEALGKSDLTFTQAVSGYEFRLNDAVVTLLWPDESEMNSANNYSVVLKIVYGEKSFLMMGDAEKEVEDKLLASEISLNADFLKVGHHGSKTSTSKAFLSAVDPDFAVITCGINNRYAHPHIDVINAMEAQKVSFFRSDINGIIKVVSDGKDIFVKSER